MIIRRSVPYILALRLCRLSLVGSQIKHVVWVSNGLMNYDKTAQSRPFTKRTDIDALRQHGFSLSGCHIRARISFRLKTHNDLSIHLRVLRRKMPLQKPLCETRFHVVFHQKAISFTASLTDFLCESIDTCDDTSLL